MSDVQHIANEIFKAVENKGQKYDMILTNT